MPFFLGKGFKMHCTNLGKFLHFENSKYVATRPNAWLQQLYAGHGRHYLIITASCFVMLNRRFGEIWPFSFHSDLKITSDKNSLGPTSCKLTFFFLANMFLKRTVSLIFVLCLLASLCSLLSFLRLVKTFFVFWIIIWFLPFFWIFIKNQET